ncbi:hypothetical protein Ae201684P_011950 [Aphanomyces euteiches]|uniref:Uncharacterized protein n=1 Tax=Aphanomyces euteiches TaxID=100861 RepID=A0A6G0WU23_9STRA|nr:hypothetical protein Ae201684_011717 [Aphanomyces euteiches]KAH9097229.1 hypothetical protein Ae201684P_011950 [Aphanomyces euteiches]KAH9157190.1 hypothetical protein AeRB84_000959 [Aphanomyces euteiches]
MTRQDAPQQQSTATTAATTTTMIEWTAEEVERFHHALSVFEEGQWKEIATYIGTSRSPQQIQAYYESCIAPTKRSGGQRRRRSWEDGHARGGPATPSTQARPNYLHPPPSLARPFLPSPRHTPTGSSSANGRRSMEAMFNGVLDLFPGTTFRDKLIKFYYEYNPSKVNEVDQILIQFRNREVRLFLNLAVKYRLTQNLPPELVDITKRNLLRATTPKQSQDSNLRMLSSIVPSSTTATMTNGTSSSFLTRPIAGRVSPTESLPTLRSYVGQSTPSLPPVSAAMDVPTWSNPQPPAPYLV